MFGGIYKGKRVLVTGHQGFCGSWLTLWLERLGAKVTGFGRPARTDPSHYNLLHDIKEGYLGAIQDLRNPYQVRQVVRCNQPELIIHLAAKAIVAKTFEEPRETFDNNIMGAVNLLDAARQHTCVKGVVFVTTDKVYQDFNWEWGYREADKLGGDDPYSVSKVCLEHIVHCYRENYDMNIAIARAGNVIGGGDWSYKRLIPDIVRATVKGEPVILHTPYATRPWQHTLSALFGYLLLGEKILKNESGVNRAFNFGPEEVFTVKQVLEVAYSVWPSVMWEYDDIPTHPHMTYLLRLDCTSAEETLSWHPVWSIQKAITETLRWYREYYEHGTVISLEQIQDFEESVNAINPDNKSA